MNDDEKLFNLSISIMFVMAIVTAFVLFCSTAEASTERGYQDRWCTMGETEVVLEDRTRVDCMTDDFAIEFGFAKSWQQDIGQALHYGIQTNRRGGVVMILEKPTDIKYWKQMQDIIWFYKLPLNTWMIKGY